MTWTRTTLTSLALLAILGCGTGDDDSGITPNAGPDARGGGTTDGGAAAPSPMGANNGQPARDAGGPVKDASLRTPAADAGVEAQPEPSLADASHGWNEVRGGPIGMGESKDDALRNDVKLTVLGEPGYEAGRGWVTRSVADSDQTELILEVRSTGTEQHCFIKGVIAWKDASGQVLFEDDSFLKGSTATDGDVLPDSCLVPGERGYVFSLHSPDKGEPTLFDRVANAEVTLTHRTDADLVPPAFKVAPLRYEMRPPAPSAPLDEDELIVTFKNVGTAPAPIETSLVISYLLLDESGLPVGRRWLDVDKDVVVAPGGTFEAHEQPWFGGRSRHLLVHIFY